MMLLILFFFSNVTRFKEKINFKDLKKKRQNKGPFRPKLQKKIQNIAILNFQVFHQNLTPPALGFKIPSFVLVIEYNVENFQKFIRFPTIELEYNDGVSVSPTTRWIGNLVLQIVSTLSSANSTFSVLIDRMYINNLKVRIIFLVIQK